MGICLVGGSSLINGSGGAEKNANQIIIGMLLIVLAQVSNRQAVLGGQLLAFGASCLVFSLEVASMLQISFSLMVPIFACKQQ